MAKLLQDLKDIVKALAVVARKIERGAHVAAEFLEKLERRLDDIIRALKGMGWQPAGA